MSLATTRNNLLNLTTTRTIIAMFASDFNRNNHTRSNANIQNMPSSDKYTSIRVIELIPTHCTCSILHGFLDSCLALNCGMLQQPRIWDLSSGLGFEV